MEKIKMTYNTRVYILIALAGKLEFYRDQLKHSIRQGKASIGITEVRDFFWVNQAGYWNNEVNKVKTAIEDFRAIEFEYHE